MKAKKNALRLLIFFSLFLTCAALANEAKQSHKGHSRLTEACEREFEALLADIPALNPKLKGTFSKKSLAQVEAAYDLFRIEVRPKERSLMAKVILDAEEQLIARGDAHPESEIKNALKRAQNQCGSPSHSWKP